MTINFVSRKHPFATGEQILTALTAADLMPCATVQEIRIDTDRLWLSSLGNSLVSCGNPLVSRVNEDVYAGEAYGIVARDHRYDVVDHASCPVFGLRDVGLETAFLGAVELLREMAEYSRCREHADMSAVEDSIGLDGRAVELSHTGICSARVRGRSLVIRHCSEPDHVAIATRNAARPWLWEVTSGDLGSDACPAPVVCGWEQLRELALDGAI